MWQVLKKVFRFKKKDLEADLQPTTECNFGGIGEVEYELWSDDSATVEASLKHSSIPDGSEIEVQCRGRKVANFVVNGGYAKQIFKQSSMNPFPQINVGDRAEFWHNGQIVYRGQFSRD